MKTRNILISAVVIIVLLAIASLSWDWTEWGDESAPITSSRMVNYQDPEGIFSFSYPENWSVREREPGLTTAWRMNTTLPGLVMATVSAPEDYMPKTNFSDAKLVIGWSNDEQAIRTCAATTNDPMQGGPTITEAEVSGFPFSKMVSTEAAAGNRYETVSYLGLLDGDCWSLEYIIHSTNLGNYPPEQGISEFDRAKVISQLESIVQSFQFLVNSN
jgi:hypothetical protein